MTYYNERLDEILAKHGAEPGKMTHSLKQALTSLIKELVAEAKPEADINMFPTDYYDGIEEYYRNLLKALGEV